MSAESGSGPVSDDQFDEALRSLLDGNAGQARFREMSAADRAKQGEKARKRAERERAKRMYRQSGGRRRMVRGVIKVTVTLVVLAGIAGGGLYAISHAKSLLPRTPQAGASSALTAAVPGVPVPATVFAGTKAAGWADGEAGIIVPAAHAVGPYSAAQVASAYATTKQLLIAGDLDRAVLLGGKPTTFADLLAQPQRTQFLAGLDAKGVWKDGSPRNTRSWVAAFAPGSADLIGDVIKVYGTLSAKLGNDSGSTMLDIEVNYLFVYPVARPGAPADWMRIIAHVTGPVEFGDWGGSSGPFAPEDLTQTAVGGAYCGSADGYIHPDYPSERTPDGSATGSVVDPYSLAMPPGSNQGTCHQTNGT